MQYAATYFNFSAAVPLPTKIQNKLTRLSGVFLDADGDTPLPLYKVEGFDIYYASSAKALKINNSPGWSTLLVKHEGILYRIGIEDTNHFAEYLKRVQEHGASVHLQIHTLAAKFQESESAFIAAIAAEREHRDLAQIEEAARKLEMKEAKAREQAAIAAALIQGAADSFKAGNTITAAEFTALLQHCQLWPAVHPRTKAYITRTLYSINNTGHYQYYQRNGRKAESACIRPLVAQLAAKLAA